MNSTKTEAPDQTIAASQGHAVTEPCIASSSATPAEAATFEAIRDAIIERMSGHTVAASQAEAWDTFLALLKMVKRSECRIAAPQSDPCLSRDEAGPKTGGSHQAAEAAVMSYSHALRGQGKTFEQWWSVYEACVFRSNKYEINRYETARDAWLAGYEYHNSVAPSGVRQGDIAEAAATPETDALWESDECHSLKAWFKLCAKLEKALNKAKS